MFKHKLVPTERARLAIRGTTSTEAVLLLMANRLYSFPCERGYWRASESIIGVVGVLTFEITGEIEHNGAGSRVVVNTRKF